jgi:hypothetical protein
MSLFIEDSWKVFLVLTLIMGGGAAFMAGRSLARGWRPIWVPILYMLPLGAALRFLHFALFGTQLTSLHYFITDTLILVVACLIGYQLTRTNQMADQYPWLYERTGPFSWRQKA